MLEPHATLTSRVQYVSDMSGAVRMYVGATRLHIILHQMLAPSYRAQVFVHMIPAFTSSNTLTGRTGRLHIFQTLVPSYRAQVFI